LIIHLDQKDWIDLSSGYNGLDKNLADVANRVVKAADSEKAIFPLSITHFDETRKRMDNASRTRLARYMVRVYKGWAILPATRIIEPEIEDACLKSLGLQGYDLRNYAIKKGISQLMGGKMQLAWKTPPPPGLNKKLLDKAESPEALLMALEHGSTAGQLNKERARAEKGVDRIEAIRKAQSRIRDNNLRHRAVLAHYLAEEVAPKVIKFLLSIGINPRAFADRFLTKRPDIIRFFQLMPTAYSVVELSFRRDMLKGRPVEANDLNDIMSLSIALPYSDVVVTERMWQSIIVQDKLDKLRPTRVLRSVRQLTPILNNL
jgi:hypothetical protein